METKDLKDWDDYKAHSTSLRYVITYMWSIHQAYKYVQLGIH